MSQTPTPADGMGPGEVPKALEPFEPPVPRDEDLRGPKTREREDVPADDMPPAEDSFQVPAEVIPGPADLPEFDPQGGLPALPSLDDSPPALPPSLQRAAALLDTAPTATADSPVQQVSWQQPLALPLVNPAAAVVAPGEEPELQQAIYYEVTDTPAGE